MDKNLQKYLLSSPSSLDEWKDIANKSLKDKSIEDLQKILDKDLKKQILYSDEDLPKSSLSLTSRGIKENHNEHLPWHICSIVDPSKDNKLYNSRILNELERGASSIEISYLPNNNFDELFNNIDLSIAPIFLRDHKDPIKSSKKFLDLLEDWKGVNKKEPLGGIDIDPIAVKAKHSSSLNTQLNDHNNFEDLFEDYKGIIKDKDHTSLSLINFDGSIWNELGSTLIQEISLLISSFIEGVKKGTIKRETAVNFTISLDTDFFLNIAKIRALRLIINDLKNHFEIEPKITLTGKTSKNIIFKESPWVNQLRITNAALSGAIANIDRLICHHITNPLGQAPEFVKRLTRNTHIILQEESNIGKIQDPSGGSFYIEKITSQIAEKSFLFIKEIQKNGGLIEFIDTTNFIKNLEENQLKNQADLKSEKVKRIGVNLYPDKEIREINTKPYEEV